jgi:hypothetical protein
MILRHASLLLALLANPVSASALLVEATSGFVPFGNDVPLMLGVGVELAQRHELLARVGWMPTGDDVNHAFGVVGYRAVFRPGRWVRPYVGALVVGLPATCGHDALSRPACAATPLFIFSATGGVRFEPTPWLGLAVALSAGVDTFPNPFAMLEVGVVWRFPLAKG